MKEILKIIEKETNGTCFGSQKYSIDADSESGLIYENYDNDKKIVFENIGETEKVEKIVNLTNKTKQILNQTPLFKYFLDGSRRVYKVDDILYNDKVYPIITGQIGIACCKRISGKMFKEKFIKENVIVLPAMANADGKKNDCFFDNIKDTINNKSKFLQKHNLLIGKILYLNRTDEKDKDYKDLATAKIQDRMIELEKELISNLVRENLLRDDTYLLKDGSLEYKATKRNDKFEYDKIRNNYRSVVGVSKSFNPALATLKSGSSMAKVIAELPNYHRTPAIMYSSDITGNEKFSIWYLRIRKSDYCSSPFDGVVKVEKLLVTENERENGLNSEVIDNISANIINERNPVCYGTDKRWANHLYPVFLTESYAKSQYLSNSFFLNMF